MISELTSFEAHLHQKAHRVFGVYHRAESEIIEVIQQIMPTQLYKKLGYADIYQYIMGEFKLTGQQAYLFRSVALCAQKNPPLQKAIAEKRINVPRASRIVACLTKENAGEMTEFAISHTWRETDFEAARRNPKSRKRDRAKPIAEDLVEIFRTLSREGFIKLERVESLEAQRGNFDKSAALEKALDLYLQRQDPVKKAERAQARNVKAIAVKPNAKSKPIKAPPIETEKDSVCTENAEKSGAETNSAGAQPHFYKQKRSKISQSAETTQNRNVIYAPLKTQRSKFQPPKFQRQPLSADTKHAVFSRDGGMCTHIGENGKRCGADRWIHVHHIRGFALGGSNELSNLTTLCSFHHELVHQLSFPLEGQISWIREREIEYQA